MLEEQAPHQPCHHTVRSEHNDTTQTFVTSRKPHSSLTWSTKRLWLNKILTADRVNVSKAETHPASANS